MDEAFRRFREFHHILTLTRKLRSRYRAEFPAPTAADMQGSAARATHCTHWSFPMRAITYSSCRVTAADTLHHDNHVMTTTLRFLRRPSTCSKSTIIPTFTGRSLAAKRADRSCRIPTGCAEQCGTPSSVQEHRDGASINCSRCVSVGANPMKFMASLRQCP